MKPFELPRRDFLARSAAATATLSLGSVLPVETLAAKKVAANDVLNLGVIGIGPRCKYDLQPMLKFTDVKVVAIAEVQASRRQEGKSLVDSAYGNTECKVYRDLRELLDRKDIDAVLIATGDRWHGAGSILAAKAGKDAGNDDIPFEPRRNVDKHCASVLL